MRIGCIAQLVNVIAPIMTEPNGPAWRQTTFFPYCFASVYGRGEALRLKVKSPGYDAEVADNVPYLDISAVHDADARTLTVFAVNRHGREDIELDLSLHGFGSASVALHEVMTSADLEAANTLARPLAIAPKDGAGAKASDGALRAKLPACSYQMIRLNLT